MLLFNIDFLT